MQNFIDIFKFFRKSDKKIKKKKFNKLQQLFEKVMQKVAVNTFFKPEQN